AQKEYDKIKHHCMPVVYTYLEIENKTDDIRLFARDEYIKRCTHANKGNVFVTADPHFFGNHFPTAAKIKEIIKPKPMARYSAIAIIAIILMIIAGIVFG